jgi:hypothetical protein
MLFFWWVGSNSFRSTPEISQVFCSKSCIIRIVVRTSGKTEWKKTRRMAPMSLQN